MCSSHSNLNHLTTDFVLSGNNVLEMQGLQSIRRILSVENAPISELIDIGIVPKLIQMSKNRSKEFNFELFHILTNIGLNDKKQSNYLIELDFLKFIDEIFDLNYNSSEKDQIIRVIGSFSDISEEIRDMIVSSPIFKKFCSYCKDILKNSDASLKVNPLWTLSILVSKGKPLPYHAIIFVDQFLMENLFSSSNEQIFQTSIKSLYHTSNSLTDLSHYKWRELELIIDYSTSDQILTTFYCSKIIGNYISKVPLSCLKFNSVYAIEAFIKLTKSHKSNIVKEGLWIISNLCIQTKKIVDILISLRFYSDLIEILDNWGSEVAKGVLWTVACSYCEADFSTLYLLRGFGWLDKLFKLFFQEEMEKYRPIILEGINYALKNTDNFENRIYKEKLIEMKIICIENFQMSKEIDRILVRLKE